MSFLQPWLLWALPLAALPILIHLINQRRYQTIRWGAMMFLLAAQRMSRGYARVRQWLILALRVLAIAALLLAVSRPLASGWMGLLGGGRADTTIVLLDRSPSMQQHGPGTSVSKLTTGRAKLVEMLNTVGSHHWVVIENTRCTPRELEDPSELLQLPSAEPASASSDIPAMLEAARDYIHANQTGLTEIWICSDLRRNDWNADSARWQSLRDAFLEFPQGIRFHLLAYAEPAPHNLAVRVTQARRQTRSDGADLLISLQITREGENGDAGAKMTVPVAFELEGARSVLNVEMTGNRHELRDHRIPLGASQERGWGRVVLPADDNPADNEFYFVFGPSPPRATAIVTNDLTSGRTLRLAASIASEPGVEATADLYAPDQLSAIPWEKTALLLWQAPLPEGEDADRVQAFVDRGGSVIFFPPQAPTRATFGGLRWTTWTEPPRGVPVASWRGDHDVLRNTLSGASLPVGELQIRRYCGLEGDFTPLAVLQDGAPLVGRVVTQRGGVYFCATTVAPSDSSLARDGVVFYVFVQRALAAGASVLSGARQVDAGRDAEPLAGAWRPLTSHARMLSTDFAFHAGVFDDGERLFAVNRPPAEDQAPILDAARAAELFRGLPFDRVEDQAGSARALIREIWRLFLLVMLVALLLEAALSMPKLVPASGAVP